MKTYEDMTLEELEENEDEFNEEDEKAIELYRSEQHAEFGFNENSRFFSFICCWVLLKRGRMLLGLMIESGLCFWSLVELLSVFNRTTGFKFSVLYLQPSFAEILCTC